MNLLRVFTAFVVCDSCVCVCVLCMVCVSVLCISNTYFCDLAVCFCFLHLRCVFFCVICVWFACHFFHLPLTFLMILLRVVLQLCCVLCV